MYCFNRKEKINLTFRLHHNYYKNMKISIKKLKSTILKNSFNQFVFLTLVLLITSLAVLHLTTKVLAVDDTEPPTAPTSLHISGTSPNSVSLAWNASTDNVGVEGYRLYRNGISSGSTPGLTYTY